MQLTAEDIVKQALPRREVEIEEWGGTVTLRALTAAEHEDFARDIGANLLTGTVSGEKVAKNVRARWVARGLINPETGRPLFPGSAGEEAVGRFSTTAVNLLFRALVELSNVSDQRREEIAGESVPRHEPDSSTASA